jgi:hypothetical protein
MWPGDSKVLFRKNCCNSVPFKTDQIKSIPKNILPWSGDNKPEVTSSCRTRRSNVQVQQSIPGLFSTGVDTNGVPFSMTGSNGTVDVHYQAVACPDCISPPEIPIYVGPLARYYHGWEEYYSPTDDARMLHAGTNASGSFFVETTFDLTNCDITRTSISFSVLADNSVQDVIINSTRTGISLLDKNLAGTVFTITNGFVHGLNRLIFWVQNDGDYAGLRVHIRNSVTYK